MDVRLGLTGQDAIAQALRTIIMTSKGVVPFRPNFGLSVEQLLGSPQINADLTLSLIDQIERYEKRITIKKIYVSDTATGAVTIKIEYKLKSTGEISTLIQDI